MMSRMSGVHRASLDLGKLRTRLFKADRVGRGNDALEAWLARRDFWRDGDRWLGEASALAALPPGVVTDRGPAVRPRPWRDDPVYGLIFRVVEDDWKGYCHGRDPGRPAWQFVLVEEYVADDGCHVQGPVVRAWRRDDNGLREMTEAERVDARRRVGAEDRLFPFVLVTFRIGPAADRVVLGQRQADTAGIGEVYVVRSDGDRLELVPDPEGGFWRS